MLSLRKVWPTLEQHYKVCIRFLLGVVVVVVGGGVIVVVGGGVIVVREVVVATLFSPSEKCGQRSNNITRYDVVHVACVYSLSTLSSWSSSWRRSCSS